MYMSNLFILYLSVSVYVEWIGYIAFNYQITKNNKKMFVKTLETLLFV